MTPPVIASVQQRCGCSNAYLLTPGSGCWIHPSPLVKPLTTERMPARWRVLIHACCSDVQMSPDRRWQVDILNHRVGRCLIESSRAGLPLLTQRRRARLRLAVALGIVGDCDGAAHTAQHRRASTQERQRYPDGWSKAASHPTGRYRGVPCV